MEYKERLQRFNSTPKYRQEMDFISCLLQAKRGEVVFDMGAGIGTLITHLSNNTEAIVLGYDQNTYGETPSWYRESVYFEVDKVVFNHSIAHISNPKEVLNKFKGCLNPGGSICVVTPNKDYLKNLNNENYMPDPTVIQHFNLKELKSLFKECGYRIVVSGQFGDQINGYNERLFLKAENI